MVHQVSKPTSMLREVTMTNTKYMMMTDRRIEDDSRRKWACESKDRGASGVRTQTLCIHPPPTYALYMQSPMPQLHR